MPPPVRNGGLVNRKKRYDRTVKPALNRAEFPGGVIDDPFSTRSLRQKEAAVATGGGVGEVLEVI
jgi:hypothetical protein